MKKEYFIVNLTEDEIQTILNGLGELPAKQSFNLIAKIAEQLKEQKAGIDKSEKPS